MMIDQIYYINLDNRVDRQFFMERRLFNFGLNSKRITAINGDVLNNFLEKFFQRNKDNYYSSAVRCAGYLSCTFSHWLAIQNALERSYETILILEDDAILHKDFDVYLDKMFDEIKKENIDWDIIYLGHYSRGFDYFTNEETLSVNNIPIKDKMLYDITNLNFNSWCCHALLYSNRNGLFNDIISDYSNNIPNDIDRNYLDSMKNRKDMKIFISFPQISIQTETNVKISKNESMEDYSSSLKRWFVPTDIERTIASINQHYVNIEKDFVI